MILRQRNTKKCRIVSSCQPIDANRCRLSMTNSISETSHKSPLCYAEVRTFFQCVCIEIRYVRWVQAQDRIDLTVAPLVALGLHSKRSENSSHPKKIPFESLQGTELDGSLASIFSLLSRVRYNFRPRAEKEEGKGRGEVGRRGLRTAAGNRA